VKVTNSNKLTDANITTILSAYTNRTDAPHFARLVPNSEVAEKAYNLSVSTYVEQEDKRERVDITALNAEIDRIVSRSNELRQAIDAIIMEIEADE
jgi:type I restriction enzyme M protein